MDLTNPSPPLPGAMYAEPMPRQHDRWKALRSSNGDVAVRLFQWLAIVRKPIDLKDLGTWNVQNKQFEIYQLKERLMDSRA